MSVNSGDSHTFAIPTRGEKDHIPTDLREGMEIVAGIKNFSSDAILADAVAEYLLRRQEEIPRIVPLLKHYFDERDALAKKQSQGEP